MNDFWLRSLTCPGPLFPFSATVDFASGVAQPKQFRSGRIYRAIFNYQKGLGSFFADVWTRRIYSTPLI